MERKSIFDAALKLIKEGRFHATPMTEIAYYAKVTGAMLQYHFESREKLLFELAQNIFREIYAVIEHTDKENSTFKKKFFKIWFSLFEYYVKNPEVIPFIEQFINTGFGLSEKEKAQVNFNKMLAEFFKSGIEQSAIGFKPETLAFIFHGNIIMAAKLLIRENGDQKDSEARHIAQILWNGLSLSHNFVVVKS